MTVQGTGMNVKIVSGSSIMQNILLLLGLIGQHHTVINIARIANTPCRDQVHTV